MAGGVEVDALGAGVTEERRVVRLLGGCGEEVSLASAVRRVTSTADWGTYRLGRVLLDLNDLLCGLLGHGDGERLAAATLAKHLLGFRRLPSDNPSTRQIAPPHPRQKDIVELLTGLSLSTLCSLATLGVGTRTMPLPLDLVSFLPFLSSLLRWL